MIPRFKRDEFLIQGQNKARTRTVTYLRRIIVYNLPFKILVFTIWLVASVSSACAAPVLPALFSDHMVLQQRRAIHVWGKAEAGERITVSLADRSISTKTDTQGTWSVHLPALTAGGPFTLTVRGQREIVVKDVMVGEVWIASGQSNMAFVLEGAEGASSELPQANDDGLRLFRVPSRVALSPQDDTAPARWKLCTPEAAEVFSAVAYFFAREIRRKLNIPIGIIESVWSGTTIEAWIAPDFLETASHEFEHPTLDLSSKITTLTGTKSSGIPRSGLYEGMIAPVVPYGFRGALWYQGESNATRAYQYRNLLSAMIRNWREATEEKDLEFLIVQLPNYGAVSLQPTDSGWAELRDAQLTTLKHVPHTGLAVTIDVGDPKDLHPHRKREVGERLALCALGTVYGRHIEYSGPLYKSVQFQGGQARIRFTHVGGGLVAYSDPVLHGFALAGPDHKFHRADAQIVGDTIVVKSPAVPVPVAVRYAWADSPVCNLFNKDGLPASPFRTDDWPRISDARGDSR